MEIPYIADACHQPGSVFPLSDHSQASSSFYEKSKSEKSQMQRTDLLAPRGWKVLYARLPGALWDSGPGMRNEIGDQDKAYRDQTAPPLAASGSTLCPHLRQC